MGKIKYIFGVKKCFGIKKFGVKNFWRKKLGKIRKKNLMQDVDWLGVKDSWRWTYWITAILGFIIAPMLVIFVEEPRNVKESV